MQRRNADRTYVVLRLDTLRSDSWAVVGQPSGAIALNNKGELIVRLERNQAQTIADELNQRELNEARYCDDGAVRLRYGTC